MYYSQIATDDGGSQVACALGLDKRAALARIVRPSCGRSSVVERLLAKEKVVSSNLIARLGRAGS